MKDRMSETIPRGVAVVAVILAAVEEYNLHHHTESDEERRGRKSAVRGLLVRLGVYEHFDTALDFEDAERAERAIAAMKEGEG